MGPRRASSLRPWCPADALLPIVHVRPRAAARGSAETSRTALLQPQVPPGGVGCADQLLQRLRRRNRRAREAGGCAAGQGPLFPAGVFTAPQAQITRGQGLWSSSGLRAVHPLGGALAVRGTAPLWRAALQGQTVGSQAKHIPPAHTTCVQVAVTGHGWQRRLAQLHRESERCACLAGIPLPCASTPQSLRHMLPVSQQPSPPAPPAGEPRAWRGACRHLRAAKQQPGCAATRPAVAARVGTAPATLRLMAGRRRAGGLCWRSHPLPVCATS